MARVRPSCFLFALALSGVAGCGSVRPEIITDEELQRTGQWTAQDALARRLLELDAPGSAARRPLRRTPLHRKVIGNVNGLPVPRPGRAAEVLLGLDYEVKYHYVARAKAYVLLVEGRPPVILAEEVGATIRLPGDELSAAAARALQHDLERDVQAIMEAAARIDERDAVEP